MTISLPSVPSGPATRIRTEMQATVSRWLDALRTGFWFLPMLMLAAAAGTALLMLHLDRNLDPGVKSAVDWAYSGGPAGARSLLSTIAGSMITAASVTFSLASVALSIASQQYGSRVLRNFMRDRITQVLLGTFVATFIYCVLVVRAIHGSDVSGGFVPAISVTFAILLALVSLILLIYFIHHVSSSIQASRIIRVIAEELEGAVPNLYPSQIGASPVESRSIDRFQGDEGTVAIALEVSGYLQTIDLDGLLEMACAKGLTFRLLVKPGDHLLAGSPVAEAWGSQKLDPQTMHRFLRAFYVDRERTPAQDIRYHFQQLTDVIVRALSPGINDPFTAINGIDELAAAMLLFTRRARVQEQRTDGTGNLRLIVPAPSAGELLKDTVGHIVIYAASDGFVMASLRRVLDTVAPQVSDPGDKAMISSLRNELDRRQRAESPHIEESPCPITARELSGKTAVVVLTAAALSIVLLTLWFGRILFLLAFAGVLLAVFLRSLTNFLKKRFHLADGLAVSITVVFLLGTAGLAIIFLGPNVEAQVKDLWQQLPGTLQQARTQLQQHWWGRRVLAQLPSASGLMSSGAQVARRSAEAVSGLLGIIGNAVVIAFIGLYLAISPDRYTHGATDLFPPPWRTAIWQTLNSAGNDLRKWLSGKLLLMVFVGVSTAAGLFVLHVPLVVPLALFAALLDFIPNIGPILSALPAVLLALTVGPYHALWVAGLYLAVQVVESYILQPFVQGKAVSLPPAVLISSQVLFGLLLGLPGVILATPLTVVFLVFVRRIYIGLILEPQPIE